MKNVVVIPVYNPDFDLLQKIRQIRQLGLTDIVIVDDGSDPAYAGIFERLKVEGSYVFHHTVNIGFGAAIKTGIKKIREIIPDFTGYILVDDCFQNSAYDILRVSHAMNRNSKNIVLAARDYESKDVPIGKRIGFKIASLIFKYTKHIEYPDVLSGLRGFPAEIIDYLLMIPGVRFEYGINILSFISQQEMPVQIISIPVELSPEKTIASYQPFSDSVKIYRTIMRFAIASISCTMLDLLLFTFFLHAIPLFFIHSFYNRKYSLVLSSTFAARIISGSTNFTINRKWSFKTEQGREWGRQVIKYFCVFFCQMTASGLLVSFFSFIPICLTALKLLVDMSLFFFNYYIQSKWVFKKT